MEPLQINLKRLKARLASLNEHGALPGGGVCRLALSDQDKAARDLVTSWMEELGLTVHIDRMGNVVAVGQGQQGKPVVMMGSHIDTVATGGDFDGNLGVIAALEVLQTISEANIKTESALAVAFFTNEEGVRFQPDMMGSSVYAGSFSLAEALRAKDHHGISVGEELVRIDYAGHLEPGFIKPKAFLELHVEQGPVLESEDIQIGCVTGVQGISWQELTIEGTSNHAGTTPMGMRQDAGYAASAISCGVRNITREMGGNQVGTCGRIHLEPNLVNVIARKAVMTVDLRNTDSTKMRESEERLDALIEQVEQDANVQISKRRLCRFEPVPFDEKIVALVGKAAEESGLSYRRMPSGAGHDAGLMAGMCPAGMIFVPSVNGISHNVEELTLDHHLEAGANILLKCALELAQVSCLV